MNKTISNRKAKQWFWKRMTFLLEERKDKNMSLRSVFKYLKIVSGRMVLSLLCCLNNKTIFQMWNMFHFNTYFTMKLPYYCMIYERGKFFIA